MARLYLFLSLLLFIACKVSDTKLIGKYYSMKSFLRSTLVLDSSSHFSFNNDSYKALFTKEEFFYTQGFWTRKSKNTIILTSIANAKQIDRVIIKKHDYPNPQNQSRFAFFNSEGDTVQIISVFKNSEALYYRSHGPNLDYLDATAKGNDSLIFYFTVGYSTLKILVDTDEPSYYQVTLNRQFRPNYFNNTPFRLRRNKLTDLVNKEKYSKRK